MTHRPRPVIGHRPSRVIGHRPRLVIASPCEAIHRDTITNLRAETWIASQGLAMTAFGAFPSPDQRRVDGTALLPSHRRPMPHPTAKA